MGIITFYWTLDLLILVITLIGFLYMYMTRKFLYWKKLGVMEIPPMPFTGNFADCLTMKKSPGEFIKDFYDRSASLPYMGFYIFDKPFLMARDPELIKNILVRDFNHFADRNVSSCPNDVLGTANLFTVKNPTWKLLRSKLTPIFTSGKLKKMFGLMLEVGEDLKTHMNSLNLKGPGSVVELKDLCAKYTTDLIGTTAYGLKVNSLNNPNAEFRRYGREIFETNSWRSLEFALLFFAPHFGNPLGLKFFSKGSSKFLRRAFWETIVEREKSGIRRDDFIDLLVDLKKIQAGTDEQKIFDFDGDNLVAQAAIFFTGGFETSSTVLSFTLYELALSPGIQTKARDEIIEALEKTGGKITYDLVMNVPYLDMVVSESLRKYPTLPFLDRVAMDEYKIPNSDLILEKGTPVYIPVFGLHHDPEYYPNPEVFDPERFTEANNRDRNPFVYLPFGTGPRNCIGNRLGLLQVKLGLIHILSEYEISPCEQTLIPMKINPKALLTAAAEGLYLNMKRIV